MYNQEDEPEKKLKFEDKAMAAMLAFMALVMSIFGAVIVWSVIDAFWHAGLINTISWIAFLGVLFWVARLFYRLIIHNDWIDRL